jgi:hypothetical protein
LTCMYMLACCGDRVAVAFDLSCASRSVLFRVIRVESNTHAPTLCAALCKLKSWGGVCDRNRVNNHGLLRLTISGVSGRQASPALPAALPLLVSPAPARDAQKRSGAM